MPLLTLMPAWRCHNSLQSVVVDITDQLIQNGDVLLKHIKIHPAKVTPLTNLTEAYYHQLVHCLLQLELFWRVLLFHTSVQRCWKLHITGINYYIGTKIGQQIKLFVEYQLNKWDLTSFPIIWFSCLHMFDVYFQSINRSYNRLYLHVPISWALKSCFITIYCCALRP